MEERFCKKCNKKLRCDNTNEYCSNHKYLSPKVKQQGRESYHRNTEHKSKYGKVYSEVNKEKIAIRKKEYYKNNKEKINARNKEYYYENYNQEYVNKKSTRLNERYNNDSFFKLKTTLRVRTRDYLRLKCIKKTKIFCEYIGCTQEQLINHIESKFQPGMSWENQGKGTNKWNIDHIIPLSSAKTEKRIYQLSHYTNLQPLWQRDNAIKSDTICPLVWTKQIERNKNV